ncbi:hypothetical protein BDA99DRAFT_543247 [Phascolomyces articulosus]|uniref:Uncharacterized protein n=1 Tax=Phascolomyces articulosus TaxID=60185 RepID=A0AAD5JN16_9FUNG|nr:hypothetical protein BDA99DRAFT_543247 [Phascolomyces articulosus]
MAKNLEHEIIRIEKEIRDKRKRATCLRAFHKHTDRQIQRQHAYHSIMSLPSSSTSNKNKSLPWLLNQDLVHQQKHSKQISIQELCDQIDHEAPDPQDIINLLAISKSANTFFDLIKQRLNELEIPDSNDGIKQSRQRVDDRHSPVKDRIHKILEDQVHDVENIMEECATLETRAGQLEQELRTRIRKLYPDISVQIILFKRICAEAQNQNMIAQRKIIQEQANALQARVLTITTSTKNNHSSDSITHNIKETVDNVVQKQNQISQKMALIQSAPEKLEKQREKLDQEEKRKRIMLLEQLERNCNELRGSVQRKIDVFHQLPLTPGSDDAIAMKGDNTRLEQIRDCFHPYLQLSRQGVIDQLGQVLTRVNALVVSDPPKLKLRETLESLGTRWQQDLGQNDISVEEPRPREDAVDAIVKLVAALIKHSTRQQSEFVTKQEKLLTLKLNMLQQAEKEIMSTVDAIEERQCIEDGTIGLDYTFEDRTLQEWMSILEE